jgi:LAO/AO transport system kinase
MIRPSLTPEEYRAGVLAGHRATLGRAITLIESRRVDHQEAARALLTGLMPHTGGAWRVGITGVPGVGKSTFIEALGLWLVAQGRKVAVLAVDPSSTRTGGSILGDKTRMELLSREERAFIRPSPSAGTPGGVASRTREAMLLCEAAGYDVVLVETVGVGQSELAVADMTDFFLVLMLAGAGDELQGIKRGLMELADALVVNKADGERALAAQQAAQTLRGALRTLHPNPAPGAWSPRVLTCSALQGEGVGEVWGAVAAHRAAVTASGALEAQRQRQQRRWLWSLLQEGLVERFRGLPEVQARLPGLEAAVERGELAPTTAAWELLRSL